MNKALMEEQLWNYVDGSATAAEKTFVEQMLVSHEEWRAKHRKLLELHQLLENNVELEQPPLRFSKNVMEGIAGMQPKPATRTYINKHIIHSIAAFFIITITALLVYSFTQVSWASSSQSTGLLPIDTSKIQLPQLDLSKIFNGTVLNILLMSTAVLCLMLFDGFLRRKKSSVQP